MYVMRKCQDETCTNEVVGHKLKKYCSKECGDRAKKASLNKFRATDKYKNWDKSYRDNDEFRAKMNGYMKDRYATNEEYREYRKNYEIDYQQDNYESLRERRLRPEAIAKKKVWSNSTHGKAMRKQWAQNNRFYNRAHISGYRAHGPSQEGCEYHHWSYNEEHYTEVIELKREHHDKLHAFITLDRDVLMFRVKKTNELLDSRDKHYAFINELINM